MDKIIYLLRLARRQSLDVTLETQVTGRGDITNITNTASVSGPGVTASASAEATATVVAPPRTDLAFTGAWTVRIMLMALTLIGLGALIVVRQPRTRFFRTPCPGRQTPGGTSPRRGVQPSISSDQTGTIGSSPVSM